MKPDSAAFRVNSRETSRRLADVSHAITSCERCPRLREHCRTVARVRKRAFRDYQVNDALFEQARPDCVFMHCLPAKRDEEVTDSIMEHSRSVIFDQAENRLHAQKALLLMMLT